MTLQEVVKNGNASGEQSPFPTLDEALSQSQVRKADNWIDAMVASSHRGPRTDIIDLTPALAKALLNRNEINRKLKETVVERYARDITAGRFEFNGASVVVSLSGKLLDGQHRCEAVVITGIAIPVVVVFGAADEARMTMDQGATRTSADYLSMDGYTDSHALAAAAAMYWQFNRFGKFVSGTTYKPTKAEVQEVVRSHEGLVKSLEAVPRAKAYFVGGRSLLTFCRYAFAVHSGNPAAATDFIIQLVEGDGLPKDSPILYARNRLFAERNRSRASIKAEIIFRAWNAWRRGETPRTLPALGGAFPKIEK